MRTYLIYHIDSGLGVGANNSFSYSQEFQLKLRIAELKRSMEMEMGRANDTVNSAVAAGVGRNLLCPVEKYVT